MATWRRRRSPSRTWFSSRADAGASGTPTEQGHRKTETHKKKDDAELALARAKVEVEERRRGLRQMRPVDVRLRDVWTVWRREVGARKGSAGTDESFWRHHLEPVFGNLGVQEIDSQRLAKFRARQEAWG